MGCGGGGEGSGWGIISLIHFFSYKVVWISLTIERPLTGHVIWGPMRSLKINYMKGDGQTDRDMDIAITRPKRPKGRFGENVLVGRWWKEWSDHEGRQDNLSAVIANKMYSPGWFWWSSHFTIKFPSTWINQNRCHWCLRHFWNWANYSVNLILTEIRYFYWQ